MDRIKTYSGIISDLNTTKKIAKYYGAAATSYTIKEYAELFNTKLEEFLTECGVDAEYDGNFLWVNGYPICFYFQQSYYFTGKAFDSSTPTESSTTATIFDSSGNYNFRVRLLGNPKSAFSLLISGNVTSLAFNSTGVYKFVKGTNIMSGRQGRLFTSSTTASLRAIDLDEDGTPINVGRAITASSITKLATLSTDFTNNVNKIPLVDSIVGIYKLQDCYMNLTSDSFPTPASSYADAQVFLSINDQLYYRDYAIGFIKCDE